MWSVEYEKADGSGHKYRWEGLTHEQATEIYRKNSGWVANTIYARVTKMNVGE